MEAASATQARSNQSDSRPEAKVRPVASVQEPWLRVLRTSLPVTVAVVPLPKPSATFVTRPPHSPRPLRSVPRNDVSEPTLPYFAPRRDVRPVPFQVWRGGGTSPASL